MCVGFWTLDHPNWSLVLCANRDEVLDRPTLPAGWHDFARHSSTKRHASTTEGSTLAQSSQSKSKGNVLSGIDVQAGGTWMGINRQGRIAMLTNITQPILSAHTISRGEYVASYLDPTNSSPSSSSSNSPPPGTLDAFVDATITPPGHPAPDTAGFNLLLLEPRPLPSPTSQSPSPSIHFDASLLSNSGSNTSIRSRSLHSGSLSSSHGELDTLFVDGLSNSIDGGFVDGLGLSEPWTKVSEGRMKLGEVMSGITGVFDPTKEGDRVGLGKMEEELVERLMGLLSTTAPTPIRAIKDMRNNIFIPAGMHIRSAFPKWYGTRLSTIIIVRRNGEVLFVERDRSYLVPRPRDGGVGGGGGGEGGGGGGEGGVEGGGMYGLEGDGEEGLGELERETVPRVLSDEEGRGSQRVFRFRIEPPGSPQAMAAERDVEMANGTTGMSIPVSV